MSARYSLAEIDAMARKAARGAGCPWGLAEEAGRAVRWLASYGLPGPEALVALFGEARACGMTAAGCRLRGDGACPLPFGAAIADRLGLIAENEPVEMANVVQPILVLAQVARAAASLDHPVTVSWPGFRAVCGPSGFALRESGALDHAFTPCLNVTPAEGGYAPIQPATTACTIAPGVWAALEQLAHNTYVPATAASRSAGAGAGLTDND